MSDFLTAEQIAERLGMSDRWVYAQFSPKGTLPSYRFGSSRRVKRADLEKWISEREERGEGGDVVQLRSNLG